MSSMFETPFMQVQRFQREVLHSAPRERPGMLNPKDESENLSYLTEELGEIFEAFYKGDLIGVADGLADLIYFAYGVADKMGLPFDDVWRVVHQSNMRKVAGVNRRGFQDDAVKPEGWIDPKTAIKELLK